MEGILKHIRNPNIQQEQQDKLMEYLSVSVCELKNTIGELSDIVKVQNNLDAELEYIDLQHLYDEVMFSLHELLKEYPAMDFQVNFEVCPVIRFSRKNLRSIFFNINSNSIKYQNANNQSYLSISSQNLGDNILLEFKDNGIGIKPEHTSEIFEMYKRFNDKVPGSGLGLYIVKRIIENNDGKIAVFSKPGIETRFEIVLSQ